MAEFRIYQRYEDRNALRTDALGSGGAGKEFTNIDHPVALGTVLLGLIGQFVVWTDDIRAHIRGTVAIKVQPDQAVEANAVRCHQSLIDTPLQAVRDPDYLVGVRIDNDLNTRCLILIRVGAFMAEGGSS